MNNEKVTTIIVIVIIAIAMFRIYDYAATDGVFKTESKKAADYNRAAQADSKAAAEANQRIESSVGRSAAIIDASKVGNGNVQKRLRAAESLTAAAGNHIAEAGDIIKECLTILSEIEKQK